MLWLRNNKMADKDEGAKEEAARDEELVQEVSGIAEVPQKLRENWTFVKRLGRFVNNKVMSLMKRCRDFDSDHVGLIVWECATTN